jgi:ABC-type branched-subunit amino acid transport system substrate-binding protein
MQAKKTALNNHSMNDKKGKKIKKHFLLPAVLLFAIIAVFYIYFTRPVKIGIIFSPDSSLGNESNLAVRFFMEKNKTIGIRPVRFFIKNPPLEKAALQRAYGELEKKGVCVILGGAVSESGVVMAEESARSGIPTFGNTASSELLSGKKDHFYRIVMSTDFQTKGMLPWFEECGFSRLLLLVSSVNREFSNSMAGSLEKYYTGHLLRLTYERSPRLTEKILAFAPDALYCILPAHEIIRLIRDIKKEKEFRKIRIISSEWAFSFFPYYSESLLENIIITSQHGQPSPAYGKLIKEFRETYRQPTFYTSDYTFSILNIIYDSIRIMGDDPEILRAYFARPRVYDYVYGRVFINEYGDALHSTAYIYEMKDGKMKQIRGIPFPDFPE